MQASGQEFDPPRLHHFYGVYMNQVCEFEYHWYFNHNPDNVFKVVDVITLTPNYTKESLIKELETVIEQERKLNTKSTISHYEIRFV